MRWTHHKTAAATDILESYAKVALMNGAKLQVEAVLPALVEMSGSG